MSEHQKKERESTSIKVDPDLWKEVKIEAIREDMEVSELVERALRSDLEKANRDLNRAKRLSRGA